MDTFKNDARRLEQQGDYQAALDKAAQTGDIEFIGGMINSMRLNQTPVQRALSVIAASESTTEERSAAIDTLAATSLDGAAFQVVANLALDAPTASILGLLSRALASNTSFAETAAVQFCSNHQFVSDLLLAADITGTDIVSLTLRGSNSNDLRQLVFRCTFESLRLIHCAEACKRLVQIVIKVISSRHFAVQFIQNTAYIHALLNASRHQECMVLVIASLARANEFDSSLGKVVCEFLTEPTSPPLSSRVNALLCTAQSVPAIGQTLLSYSSIINEIANDLECSTEKTQATSILLLSELANKEANKRIISNTFGKVIRHHASSHSSIKIQTLAKSLNIKLTLFTQSAELARLEPLEEYAQIVTLINDILDKATSQPEKSNAIETLLCLSSLARNKEALTSPSLVKQLIELSLQSNATDYYGVAAIIYNLTSFKKVINEEEASILKLRAMAEGQGVKEDDPLESNEAVTLRCTSLVDSGVVTVLASFTKNASQTLQDMLATIFLNLTVIKTNRGILIQGGGVKTLLVLADNKESSGLRAAQSLARLGITSDPTISFKGTINMLILTLGQRMVELVRPFLRLLSSEDTLSQFEGLMALTNLASSGGEARSKIHALNGVSLIEGLILSEHFMVRRAGVEAFCNMLFDEAVFDEFVRNTKRSAQRVTLLVALCSADDFETCRGASGALSVLTCSEALCGLVCQSDGFNNLLALMEDESDELVHRAAVCVRNICRFKDLCEPVVERGGLGALRVLAETDSEAISLLAVEALALMHRSGSLIK